MSGRRTLLVILICLAVSIFCVAYPIYVIRPFRAQGPRELAAALLVLRYRSLAAIVSALVALGAAARFWRGGDRMWRRVLSAVGALLVCALAVLARVNVYELMFHPVGRPSFMAADASKLDKDEKVIAVKIGDAARAYPIRIVSYHHVVNDEAGGVALAATY
jgi:hypothetical protein